MAILLFLIPISLLLVIFAVWAFVAAVRGGQFDDLDTPPLDILRDDDGDTPLRHLPPATTIPTPKPGEEVAGPCAHDIKLHGIDVHRLGEQGDDVQGHHVQDHGVQDIDASVHDAPRRDHAD